MHQTDLLLLTSSTKHSGIHAILEWILPQADTSFFINDLQYPPVLDLSRHPDIDICKRSDLLIAGFEQGSPQILAERSYLIDFVEWKKLTNLIIVRDPLNFLASTLQYWKNYNRKAQQLVPMMRSSVYCWKAHAREYLGDTNFLENKVCVNFNLWFYDPAYRKLLSQALGLKFTDESKETLATTGRWTSSAFDNREYEGKASDMDVMNRWQHLFADDTYLKWLDDEMQDYGERIYGPWFPRIYGSVADGSDSA